MVQPNSEMHAILLTLFQESSKARERMPCASTMIATIDPVLQNSPFFLLRMKLLKEVFFIKRTNDKLNETELTAKSSGFLLGTQIC